MSQDRPTTVVPPEECEPYLTPGREYQVKEWYGDEAFSIDDDDGEELLCLRTGCMFLHGGDWIIKGERGHGE